MANQAKVTSLEAIETFRASIIIFLTKARRSMDDTRDQVRRTRLWLQHDQRMHWEGEVRRLRKVLEQAKQELLSAKLSGARETTAIQQKAVIKAQQALEAAEEKLRSVQRWNRDFDSLADPLMKQLENPRAYLDHDMPKAVAYLVQVLRTLGAYAETAPPADSMEATSIESETPSQQ